MTTTVALRASAFFTLIGLVFGALEATSGTGFAELLFVTALALAAVTALFGVSAPTRAPVPVRVRR